MLGRYHFSAIDIDFTKKYEWNVTLSGLIAPPDWSPGVLVNVVVASYLPTTIEILVAPGIDACAVLGFTIAARFFLIYNQKAHSTGFAGR